MKNEGAAAKAVREVTGLLFSGKECEGASAIDWAVNERKT